MAGPKDKPRVFPDGARALKEAQERAVERLHALATLTLPEVLPDEVLQSMEERKAALLVPEEKDRARAVVKVQYERNMPSWKRNWPPKPGKDFPPGRPMSNFGRAVWWAMYQSHYSSLGFKGILQLDALREDAAQAARQWAGRLVPIVKEALDAGEDIEGVLREALVSAFYEGTLHRPSALPLRDEGLIRDVNRMLMVVFLARFGAVEPTRERAEMKDAPYRTAYDAVALGEAVCKRGQEMPWEDKGIAEHMLALLAFTPDLEAVGGIVECAENEARRFAEIIQKAPKEELQEEFDASLRTLQARVGRLKEDDTSGNAAEMPAFRSLLNVVSKYRRFLPSDA